MINNFPRIEQQIQRAMSSSRCPNKQQKQQQEKENDKEINHK
jgi:hypothetical protein